MNKYTCIIVDDEPLARQILQSYVDKIPYLDVVAVCQNAIEAKLAIQEKKPDILYIDIQMPNLSGIELLKMLSNKPATVLTTAYSEFAIDGYELDVIDYLLKPIEFERFFKATNKCMEWIDMTSQKVYESPINKNEEVVDTQTESKGNYFFVKSDYKTIKIIFDQIQYIEALQKYVRIHTLNERIVTLMSMSQLEEALPQNQFVRIHRSHIINIDNVDNIEGNIVTVGKFKLPISKGQKEVFFDFIKARKLGF